MISVLLPTRRRPDGLRRAVASVAAHASRPSEVTFLLCTDEDDTPAAKILLHESVPSVMYREFRGPRRGYARVFEHYNEMAREAAGSHVLLWNDDTEMLTQGWDELLLDSIAPEVQFLRRDIYGQADTALPFIDQRIVDALGGISRHMYTDTWIAEVAALAGVMRLRNDVVYAHHWPQQDATMREGVEAIRKSGQHERFRAMAAEKADDAAKIKQLLAGLGL